MRTLLRRTLFIATFLLLLAAPSAWAQQGVITGTVVDSVTAETLPGVNVVVEGTQLGAATNINGRFRISGVPTGPQTLVASFVGYDTRRVPLTVQPGRNQVQIELAPATIGLKDVVVTALGVQRERAALGYSVQSVDGAELAAVPETNFLNSLKGQLAGAQFYSANTVGGSTRIVLRGPNSVSGNNQPLIVVDGIPINNSNITDAGQAAGYGGYDYGNAASMINPSNIQSVSVLKGPAAAALYGSRGANGVIEITTKSGEMGPGVGVTVNTSVMASEVYSLPDYQNEFGGGYAHPFLTLDGDFVQDSEEDDFIVSYGEDESWGPRLDGRMVRQWYSWDNVNGLMGEETPWVAHPNNVENYFETGLNFNTTVAFTHGGEDFNYRASLSNIEATSIYPNQDFSRKHLSFNGAADLTDAFNVRVIANYMDSDMRGRPLTGYGNNNPFLQFTHFGHRQVQLGQGSYMRDIFRPDGTQRAWNWDDIGGSFPAGAQAGAIRYTDNPYFIRYQNFQTDDTERIYGKVRLAYDLTERVSVSAEAGTDHYTERRGQRIDVASNLQSDYTEQVFEVQETQGQARVMYDGSLGEDFSLRAFGATEYRYENFNENTSSVVGGLIAPDVYTVENSTARPSITDFFEEKAVYSLYGAVNLGWRSLLFLDLTARNDWSSTLPEGSNSFFYPSATTSFVFSRLPGLQDSDILSFGKVRAALAQVGSDTSPYQLYRTYTVGTPFSGNPVQSVPANLLNNELKPEITTSWEVGTQLQFFNNRLSLDATYYSETTRDQILAVDVSRSTGYESVLLNAGEISNKGLELTLTGTPLFTANAQWDFTVNWSKNVSKVVQLAEGLQAKDIGAAPVFGPPVQARVGYSYGAIFGSTFVRDANGNIVLTDAGTPAVGQRDVLGSYQPDWTGGFSTTFSYKGLSASVALNGQMGGKIYSLSNTFGLYSGMLEETVAGNVRALGVNPGGVWFPQNYDDVDGNDVDPAANVGQPYNGRVPAISFFKGLFPVKEAWVYDATYVQLREVRIAYQLPQQWLNRTPITSLTVSAVGQNLGVLYKEAPNINPAYAISAGNLQGLEAGQLPPQRSYGVSLQLRL